MSSNLDAQDQDRFSPRKSTFKTLKITALFAIACLIGVVHALFSAYWAVGGRWMLGSVGSWAVDWVDVDPVVARTVLAALAVVKLAAAVLPLGAILGRIPLCGAIFAVSWTGSILLILWGGLSFLGAVIGLMLTSENREVKIGHLFFDGAFFLWGMALLAGLILQRRERFAVA